MRLISGTDAAHRWRRFDSRRHRHSPGNCDVVIAEMLWQHARGRGLDLQRLNERGIRVEPHCVEISGLARRIQWGSPQSTGHPNSGSINDPDSGFMAGRNPS